MIFKIDFPKEYPVYQTIDIIQLKQESANLIKFGYLS